MLRYKVLTNQELDKVNTMINKISRLYHGIVILEQMLDTILRCLKPQERSDIHLEFCLSFEMLVKSGG